MKLLCEGSEMITEALTNFVIDILATEDQEFDLTEQKHRFNKSWYFKSGCACCLNETRTAV